jgi:chromosome partitioning protein
VTVGSAGPREAGMRILALVNQKGGCGKTTTAIHLAALGAASGRRTLLVDLDPQGHATLGLGVGRPEREKSVAAVLSTSGLDDRVLPLREVLVGVSDSLWVAPAGAELAELEPLLSRVAGGEERLAEHLAPLVDDFEQVVIDAPPSLGLLTLNALMAAGEVIVPVEPSLYSLHGLARLTELIRLLGDRSHHPIRFRVMLNAFDRRTRFARRTLEEVQRRFPDQLLRTTIRQSVKVREAAARGLSVDRFSRHALIVADYEALDDELQSHEPLPESRDRPSSVSGLVVSQDGVYLTRRDVEPDEVRIAGDFNDWVPDSGVFLEVHDDGAWTKFVPLRPGRYEYKLVVNGRWVSDPLNPRQVPNDSGSTNSVLEIDH